MNCKGRRYLLNFCVGLLGGNGQEEWATFCTIVWWSNGGLKGKPPVRGQHVCLADAERSSSQPKTNEYWGCAWLFLALITNYIRLYSWKWVKILLRPFWSHFTYPQSRILSPFKKNNPWRNAYPFTLLFVMLIIFDKRYSVRDICFKMTLLVKFEAFPKSVQGLLIHAIPVV